MNRQRMKADSEWENFGRLSTLLGPDSHPKTSQFTSAFERIAARQSSINNPVSESTLTEASQTMPPESARDAWLAPIEVL